MKLCMLLCLAGALWGQTRNATGTFTGKIMAPGGTAVSSAKVVITNGAGLAKSAVSGADGVFSVADLPEGTYRVEVAVPGYKKLTESNVQVTDGSPLTLKLTPERKWFHRKSAKDSSSEKK